MITLALGQLGNEGLARLKGLEVRREGYGTPARGFP